VVAADAAMAAGASAAVAADASAQAVAGRLQGSLV